MSDKEDRKSARKTLKTAKKGSAAYTEARGILSGDDPEKREYRKTTRKNKNKTNPYKDVTGMTGYVMGSFPETMMDIEDAIGFGKIYEGDMKVRGRKSLKKTDEDYSGDRPTKKKMGGGKVYKYGHGGGLGKTKVKRISKNETNGNKIVDNCYKNYD